MTALRDASYEDRERHAEALQLLELAKRGEVELGVPPQGMLADLHGQFDGELAGRVRGLLGLPGVIELPQIARLSDVTFPADNLFPGAYVRGFDEGWAAVATNWNGPGRRPGNLDRWYVESHLLDGREVLVTDDLALRSMCDRLRKEHGLPVTAEALRACLARILATSQDTVPLCATGSSSRSFTKAAKTLIRLGAQVLLMVAFPADWDPESAGSRFTSRPALAILTRGGGVARFDLDSDTGVASEVIADAIGASTLTQDPSLGAAAAVDGAEGRGASAWAPVIEWTVQVVIGGVVGNAAWAAATRASRRLRAMAEQLRDDGVRFNVSRGAAALVAIGHVLDQGLEDDVLDVEAVEEPSMMAGAAPPELNYVGAEPWLVLLVNARRTYRYLVVVSPDGRVAGMLKLPLSELESLYLPLPPRE